MIKYHRLGSWFINSKNVLLTVVRSGCQHGQIRVTGSGLQAADFLL